MYNPNYFCSWVSSNEMIIFVNHVKIKKKKIKFEFSHVDSTYKNNISLYSKTITLSLKPPLSGTNAQFKRKQWKRN